MGLGDDVAQRRGRPTWDLAAGVVAGVPWGASQVRCAEALGALDAGASRERLTARAPLVLAGVSWRATVELEDGGLWCLALDAVGGRDGLDHAALSRLLVTLDGWLGAPLARRDEGYYQAEAGATRLTLDLLEGTLRFEESEP